METFLFIVAIASAFGATAGIWCICMASPLEDADDEIPERNRLASPRDVAVFHDSVNSLESH